MESTQLISHSQDEIFHRRFFVKQDSNLTRNFKSKMMVKYFDTTKLDCVQVECEDKWSRGREF